MGGRGAASGISRQGKAYGTEYETLLTSGNIKFVRRLGGAPTAPMETMTRGRVYVTVDSENNPKYISYYDVRNQRTKQIDLDRPHRGISPHTHHGFEHSERDSAKGYANLTAEEKQMVERVQNIWYNKNGRS